MPGALAKTGYCSGWLYVTSCGGGAGLTINLEKAKRIGHPMETWIKPPFFWTSRWWQRSIQWSVAWLLGFLWIMVVSRILSTLCYDLIPSFMSLHGSLQNAPNLRKSNLNSSKLYNWGQFSTNKFCHPICLKLNVKFWPFLGFNYPFSVRTRVTSQILPLCPINTMLFGNWTERFRGCTSVVFLGHQVQPNG